MARDYPVERELTEEEIDFFVENFVAGLDALWLTWDR
jgi:hypothetical protein